MRINFLTKPNVHFDFASNLIRILHYRTVTNKTNFCVFGSQKEPLEIEQLKWSSCTSGINLALLKNNNFILQNLKCYVFYRTSPEKMTQDPCQIQKIFKSEIDFQDEILTFHQATEKPVPFLSFLVELAKTLHLEIAHIRDILVALLIKKVFYSSLYKVARDIDTTGVHCQLQKASVQIIAPPILQIVTQSSFELFDMDVVLFPKTTRNFSCKLNSCRPLFKMSYNRPGTK